VCTKLSKVTQLYISVGPEKKAVCSSTHSHTRFARRIGR